MSARSGTDMDIDPDCAYLINPGSVGQPRDGDPRAAYVIYDSGAGMVTYRGSLTTWLERAGKIREAGLPSVPGGPAWRGAGEARNCGADWLSSGGRRGSVGSSPT